MHQPSAVQRCLDAYRAAFEAFDVSAVADPRTSSRTRARSRVTPVRSRSRRSRHVRRGFPRSSGWSRPIERSAFDPRNSSSSLRASSHRGLPRRPSTGDWSMGTGNGSTTSRRRTRSPIAGRACGSARSPTTRRRAFEKSSGVSGQGDRIGDSWHSATPVRGLSQCGATGANPTSREPSNLRSSDRPRSRSIRDRRRASARWPGGSRRACAARGARGSAASGSIVRARRRRGPTGQPPPSGATPTRSSPGAWS